MKFELKDNLLTLYFEGELNSYNALNVEQEIDQITNKQKFASLILDFSSLTYISSAGLRIILKQKQKYNNVSIIEASLEVYDVLSMTGFVNMMDIKKALKRVSVEGAQVIGEGFFSTVYRIDKDMIIKVFNRTSDPSQIERELSLAKQAFVLGIPTAISFDVVKVEDKLGVRFEMLDCKSLKNTFLDNPDKYDYYVQRYIELLKKINTTECFSSDIPDMKEFFLKKAEVIKPYLDEKHFDKLKILLRSIPETHTFVHGDCHFKNIMVQGDDLLLIDMDTLSVGHPIFELATLYAPYVAFEEDSPGNCEKFLGVKAEFASGLYDDILYGYLARKDLNAKNKIRLVCYLHMVWWTLTNTPDDKARLNGCKDRLIELLDKYSDLNID